MKRGSRTGLRAVILALMLASARASAENPSMEVQLVPATIVGDGASTVIVTIASSDASLDSVVAIEPPPGFRISRSPGENLETTRLIGRSVLRAQIEVDPTNPRPIQGDRPLVVSVTGTATALHSVNDGSVPPITPTVWRVQLAEAKSFTYRSRISTEQYLGLGELGALLGWIVRSVNGFNSVPPTERTALANEKLKTSLKLTVDLLLTLVLGAIVLAQVSGSTAWDAGATWYGAISVGVGLGLLANAQLISKFPR